MREIMRSVHFRPYRQGMGPSFTLRLFDTGTERIGYSLSMRQNRKRTILFDGDDFRPSPMHSIDGDEAVEALIRFLTLQPGDTDSEYFDNYTSAQRQ